MKYIDAHCHLQFDVYDEDREAIITEMKEKDIHAIVVGVDLHSSKQAIALAEKHDNLYATVGLHPGYVREQSFDRGAFKEIAQHPKVVAIGECGLDYFREEDKDIHKVQKEVFQQQIELAKELEKPLMIHGRPEKGNEIAFQDIADMLTPYKGEISGNVHFFVGSNEMRDKFKDLNFTVSVTGVITFTDDYNAMVEKASTNMLLAETDSPYVAPKPLRGTRNSALNVVYVYEKIADIWGISQEEAREQLTNNTRRVFGL